MNTLKIKHNELCIIYCESENIDMDNTNVTLEPYEKLTIEINGTDALLVGCYRDARRLLVDFRINGTTLDYKVSELMSTEAGLVT